MLKILNNGRVYITRSVITEFFYRGPRRRRYNGVAVNSYSVYFKNNVLNFFNPIKENDDPYI